MSWSRVSISLSAAGLLGLVGCGAGTPGKQGDGGCAAKDWSGTYDLTGASTNMYVVNEPVAIDADEAYTSLVATVTNADAGTLQIDWTNASAQPVQTWTMSACGDSAKLLTATAMPGPMPEGSMPITVSLQCQRGTGALAGTTLTLACTSGTATGSVSFGSGGVVPFTGSYSDSWSGPRQ